MLLTFVPAVLSATAVSAQTPRTLEVPGGPAFSLVVPLGYSVDSSPDGRGNTVVRMENPVWPILIEVVVVPTLSPVITEEGYQKSQLIDWMAQPFSRAVEQDYAFRLLGASSGTGMYCVLTDSMAKPGATSKKGEYQHTTGGIKAWPGCLVLFRIRSNGTGTEEYREAFAVFRDGFEPL